MSFTPTMTEPEAPLVRELDHWIEALFGRPAEHVASPGTYDQKHITRFGTVRDCVAYGRASSISPISRMNGLASRTCWFRPR